MALPRERPFLCDKYGPLLRARYRQPLPQNLLVITRRLGQVQPLIDVQLPGDVVAGQQVGFFAVLQVVRGVDGAQAGFELLFIKDHPGQGK